MCKIRWNESEKPPEKHGVSSAQSQLQTKESKELDHSSRIVKAFQQRSMCCHETDLSGQIDTQVTQARNVFAYFSEMRKDYNKSGLPYIKQFLLSSCVVYASCLIYGHSIGLSATNFLSTVKPIKWLKKESIKRIGPRTTQKKATHILSKVNRFIEILSHFRWFEKRRFFPYTNPHFISNVTQQYRWAVLANGKSKVAL